MVQFVCDSCSAVREDDQPWILGIAAEALGVTAARRELTVFPTWDWNGAVHPLAVHFCSLECKNKYMERLFGPDSRPDEIMVERSVPVETVVERVGPAKERVLTRVQPRRRPHKKRA